MKEALAVILLLLISLEFASAAEKKAEPTKPTAKQLQAAKAEFARIGGVLSSEEPCVFRLRVETTDEDLKQVPNLPFLFGLNLRETQVTDDGMKEITRLQNVTGLEVAHIKVTGAGIKEIAKLKNLTKLDLN